MPNLSRTPELNRSEPVAPLITLAGNPNSGKTSLFNALTGARQHVGNYPGVTIERRAGFRHHNGRRLEIVDLPGTYSLADGSPEERVARDVLVSEWPDVALSVVDASNLERNLYLTVQLAELGLPVVVALNMVDVARAQGTVVDASRLSSLLRAPVIPTVARRGEGVEPLLDAIRDRLAFPPQQVFQVDYGPDLEREIGRLEGLLSVANPERPANQLRGLAVALLEGIDTDRTRSVPEGVREAARQAASRLERLHGDPVDILIAERRHGAAAGLARQAVRSSLERRRDLTDLVDRVLVHRVLGLPIFLAIMYAVFFFTFTVAEAPMAWIEIGIGQLTAGVASFWSETSMPLIRALMLDGVLGGVGGVLVFLPNIVLLFLAISLLEDSGYMARAAFLMDRVMRTVGLHGKSFIPMLLGFGCSVPAIMATRTIESRRARLTTMLVIPLMSCSARLPIYALIIPAFFATQWRAAVLWSIYVIGVVLAMGVAWVLRTTLFAGRGLPFLMELPPYRLPTARSVILHMGGRAWMYLRKAGTIILAISIVMWALSTFPRLEDDPQPITATTPAETSPPMLAEEPAPSAATRQLRHSVAGRLGVAMEPVLAPMGFDWRIGTALVGAFAAKEVFVAQMAIVFSVEAADDEISGAAHLRDRLRASYSPLVGFCVMLFALIASPCMATVAVTRRESGGWHWAALQFVGLTVLAWLTTTLVYQVGATLGL